MKDVASESNHNTNGQSCQETIAPPIPFAENRYRRHRFARESIELDDVEGRVELMEQSAACRTRCRVPGRSPRREPEEAGSPCEH